MPPILSVAPFDTVIVPPAADRFIAYDDRSSVPAVTVRSPLLTISSCASVTVPEDLSTVKLRKVVVDVPPIVRAPVPLKVTVTALPDMSTAALAVQSPDTLKLTAWLSNTGSTSHRTL